MTVKYLLTCTCGQDVAVTTTQAGSDVPCPCGKSLPVPTLLQLKQLPQVQEDQPKTPAKKWTPLQGGVFVAGAVVTLVALGTAGYLAWQRSQLKTEKPKIAGKLDYIADTRKRSMDELWEYWEVLSDEKLWPRRRPRIPIYAIDRKKDAVLRRYLSVAVGVALAGLALSSASFFIRIAPPGQQRRRKRPPPA
jgi:hypothetical protein